MNNLELRFGPDKNTTWDEAKEWVESLGDGWRMPTVDELKQLYETDPNITSKYIWSCETTGSSSAWYFYFSSGYEYWGNRSYSNRTRGFAVRSRNNNKEVEFTKDDMIAWSRYSEETKTMLTHEDDRFEAWLKSRLINLSPHNSTY